MKKLIFLTIALFAMNFAAKSQSFGGENSNVFSVALGSNLNSYNGAGLQFNYDRGIHEFISVGGQLNAGIANGFDFYIGPRADVHLLNIAAAKKDIPLDVYVGATMGLGLYTYSNALMARFWGGGYVGLNWQCSKKIALRFETGSSTTIGASFKF